MSPEALVLGALSAVRTVPMAIVYGVGRPDGTRAASRPDGPRLGRFGERLRHPTVPAVAATGTVTNLPGLYFLAGLVAILATEPSAVGGAVQVGVYTVLRFGGPIAVLVLVVLRPEGTVELLRRLNDRARRHRRALIGGVLGAVGLYLVAKGVVELA